MMPSRCDGKLSPLLAADVKALNKNIPSSGQKALKKLTEKPLEPGVLPFFMDCNADDSSDSVIGSSRQMASAGLRTLSTLLSINE